MGWDGMGWDGMGWDEMKWDLRKLLLSLVCVDSTWTRGNERRRKGRRGEKGWAESSPALPMLFGWVD